MPLLYIFGSVILVSLISLVGVITLALQEKMLKKILLFLVSFSAGALLGGAFIHLIPESFDKMDAASVSVFLLAGIILFFITEKILQWRHCHVPTSDDHPHTFAYMNLVGDGIHNFTDGMIIAASYLVSMPLGIAATIAIILHEIPQEIGDFGVLIYGGFSKKQAILMNLLTALTAVLGAAFALLLTGFVANIELVFLPFAAGGFIYIAATDLMPELHKETDLKKSGLQLVMLVLGMGIMFGLTLLGGAH